MRFTVISNSVSINLTLSILYLYCMVVVILLLLFLALLGVIAEWIRHWTLSRKVGGLNLSHGVVELGRSSSKPMPHPTKMRQLLWWPGHQGWFWFRHSGPLEPVSTCTLFYILIGSTNHQSYWPNWWNPIQFHYDNFNRGNLHRVFKCDRKRREEEKRREMQFLFWDVSGIFWVKRRNDETRANRRRKKKKEEKERVATVQSTSAFSILLRSSMAYWGGTSSVVTNMLYVGPSIWWHN